MALTTLNSLFDIYETRPPKLRFQARTRPEWQSWREALLEKLDALLGGFAQEGTPLNPVIVETTHEPGYQVEKVLFECEPGLRMPCYVLLPDHARPPYRPVIALHGHGTGGANYLLGRPWDESTRPAEEEIIRKYNHDYARQLAQKGFMVFVPVQRGLGERLETDPGLVTWKGAGMSSCRMLSFNAMLLGKTLLGLRVSDVIRTVDYIRSRPEPMIEGLGCLGFSGGGTTALFTAAVDPRITAVVASGCFNYFRTSIMAMVHCECNYIPHLVEYAEMPDIAGLIAPRPLLIESGMRDGIFPVEHALAAYQDLRAVYELLGETEMLAQDIHPADHQFSGAKAFDWLQRWLQ
jgi:dienelactone hydrolase